MSQSSISHQDQRILYCQQPYPLLQFVDEPRAPSVRRSLNKESAVQANSQPGMAALVASYDKALHAYSFSDIPGFLDEHKIMGSKTGISHKIEG